MKWLVVLVVLFGCSGPPKIDPPPPIPDSGIVDPPPPCDPSMVDEDILNCGACGSPCDPSNSDRCSAGVCFCGPTSPCGEGLDCRSGRCIEPDLTGKTCEFDEECIAGFSCIEGHCTFVECVPEDCDGYDNDCDGLIDNAHGGPLSQFCVGDMSAEARPFTPPCAQGVRVCQGGSWTECTGDVAPVEESGLLACDGIDNNCDGCVDGIIIDDVCNSVPSTTFDVLFLIDSSGSMGDNIDIVKAAVRLFSTRLSGSGAFRWGIVKIPGAGSDGVPELYLDLTTFVDFESHLSSMGTEFGGVEPQWDAVYEAVTGELGVSWRSDSARIMILFTDEAGQSSRTMRGLGPDLTEADMCGSFERGEILISVVETIHQEDFDDCAHRIVNLPSGRAGSGASCSEDSDCGLLDTCASHLCVSAIVAETADHLDSVLGDPCSS